jgi:hypothetical protein
LADSAHLSLLLFSLCAMAIGSYRFPSIEIYSQF